MATFLDISVQSEALSPEQRARLVTSCPVEIFALEGDQVIVRDDQVDECTLCEVCLKIAPAKAILIRKKYKDDVLISAGES